MGGCCVGNCCFMDNPIVNFVRDLFDGSGGSSSGGKTESYDKDTASLTLVR